VKYKRLYLDSPDLHQREKGNAGFDLPSYEEAVIEPGTHKILATGLAFEIPEGWVGLVVGRSGLRFKSRTHVDDVGVIDSNYRGEVKVLLENDGPFPLVVQQGDRIGQMIVVPYYDEELEEVKELLDSNRGSNGFGSTGLKEILQWD